MERVASVTTSYYKFAEAAILVFALDNVSSFNSLSQHMLDIVTYAENAKIFLCGNKMDLEEKKQRNGGPTGSDQAQADSSGQVTDADTEEFCEQCQNLISATFKTSCKTGVGIEEMMQQIAQTLVDSNRSRIELQTLDQNGFRVQPPDESEGSSCAC